MPIIKISTAVRNAMAQQIIDALDAGAGPALLLFYTGEQPAGPDTFVTSQTLLGTLTCSDPVGNKAAGVITFSAITQDSAADATGAAAWARLQDSDGVAVADFDVTNEAGTGAIKLNTVNIVAGGPIQMSALVISLGGA